MTKSCQKCERIGKDGKLCFLFLGESVGWQWWPISEENTCEQWKSRDE